MDIATEAKYLLCGLPALISERTLNIVVCSSRDRIRFEKKLYEDLIRDKITFSSYNKTIFKNGGEIIWKSGGIMRGYSASIIVLIGLDENSKEYSDLLPCTKYGKKLYIV